MAVTRIRLAIATCLLCTFAAAPTLSRDIFVDNVAGSDIKKGRRPDASPTPSVAAE